MKNYTLIVFLFLPFFAQAQTDRFTLAAWKTQASMQTNMQPMYGENPKTENELRADKEFLEAMRLGQRRKNIRYKSGKAAMDAWINYYSGALDIAMFRFNQAWLIDSTNMAPYIGFATVYSTLGDTKMDDKMYTFVKRHDTITSTEFHKTIEKNINYFRKLEQNQYRVLEEYKPVGYYATGQLFIERKRAGTKYHYKWYYENGSLLRLVDAGEDQHYWKGEVISYHDNGAIAHKGKWRHTVLKRSVWTSYDTDGNVSQIEYWRKGFMSSNYKNSRTIVYSQEIPWKKGSYNIISKSGWELDEDASEFIYPDGYIVKVYNSKDPFYNYYAIWKDGKRGSDLIKVTPDDCEIRVADGNYEWFRGKLYKLKEEKEE